LDASGHLFVTTNILEDEYQSCSGKRRCKGERVAVKVDESFVGPKPQRMHRDRRLKLKSAEYAGSKAIVMGMLDRDSREVRAKVIPNVKRETLQAEILNQIEHKTAV
jgi:hypothetical protein